MGDRPDCHCSAPANVYDQLTDLWQCIDCKYAVHPTCECSSATSFQEKAAWVRRKQEVRGSLQRRPRKRLLSEEEIARLRADAWDEGYVAAVYEWDEERPTEKNPYRIE